MKKMMQKIAAAVLCGGVLWAMLLPLGISVNALDNGVYLAKATPYYVHPVTGVVEDSGGVDSVGIGQPMTDSATYPQALIEVDPDGNTFATVRITLMDNIEDVSFQVQENGTAPFYDAPYDVMQENLDQNYTDYRMQIPSENAYLRATFYVAPMGRYVIYYIGFSELQSGSGDFITSVAVVPQNENSDVTETPAETALPETTTAASETTVTKSTTQTTSATTTAQTAETILTTVSMPKAAARDAEDGDGLILYDENGEKMQLSQLTDHSKTEKETQSSASSVAVIVVCVGIAVAGGAALTVFLIRKRKEKQK